jgi:hypothetical protein
MRQPSRVSSRPEHSTPTSERRDFPVERPAYDTPTVFVIGESRDLLRGSGRHKNDDTGSRGFVVG